MSETNSKGGTRGVASAGRLAAGALASTRPRHADSIHVRDNDVDALAAELQKLTKARTKTEAVRLALQHEIERSHVSVPLAKLQERATAIGLPNPKFDMKKFTDEMWSDD
jgi:antitoxin VapB